MAPENTVALYRFVIVRHDTPDGDYHWDLMFDTGESRLRTFSIASAFVERERNDGCVRGCAVPLPHHRKIYLDFEGEVSNHRGSVRKVDSGTFRIVTENMRQPGRSGKDFAGSNECNTEFQFQGETYFGSLKTVANVSGSTEYRVEFFRY